MSPAARRALALSPDDVPPGLRLTPGVEVTDPARLLASIRDGLVGTDSHPPTAQLVRQAERHARLLVDALPPDTPQ